MRLIDADALIDDIKNNLWDWETVDGITATTVLKQTISDIGNQPIIEERKKGKWIPMEVSSGRDSWKCSVCGRRARGKLKNLPYCHCGADMRGEDHEQAD